MKLEVLCSGFPLLLNLVLAVESDEIDIESNAVFRENYLAAMRAIDTSAG